MIRFPAEYSVFAAEFYHFREFELLLGSDFFGFLDFGALALGRIGQG
jgi:hypothetical protein